MPNSGSTGAAGFSLALHRPVPDRFTLLTHDLEGRIVTSYGSKLVLPEPLRGFLGLRKAWPRVFGGEVLSSLGVELGITVHKA
jgi:hypothetical protein